MPETPSRLEELLRELKRRRVLRVAAVYSVAGWVVIQVAETVAEPLYLPEWTTTLVLVLVLLGFPLAVVLAWAFDLTGGGLERTEPPSGGVAARPATADPDGSGIAHAAKTTRSRWTAGRIAVVGAAVVLALAGSAMLTMGDEEPVATVENRVVVLPFDNRTGEAELDELGLVAADWITDGLTAIDTVQVVPTTAVRARLAEVGEEADPLSWLAQKAEAGLAVTGSYLVIGDSVEVRAQLVDAQEGRMLDSFEPSRSPRAEPTAALVAIREQVMGAVAARLDGRLSFAATQLSKNPASYESYRAFLVGVELFLAGQYSQAIQELDRATAADPASFAPRVWVVGAFIYLGQPARADSVLDLIEPHRAELSEGGRITLDIVRSHLRGDRAGAYRAAREWARRAPGSLEHLYAGLYALLANRPGEAVRLVEAVPEDDRVSLIRLYLPVMTDALYALGRHERELDVARAYRETEPGWRLPIQIEARALAALGRPREAEALVDDLLLLPSETAGTARAVWTLADALAAHGHDDAAERVYERGLQLLEADGRPDRPIDMVAWTELFRRTGHLAEAARLAIEAHAVDPEDLRTHALVGLVAAQIGDRQRAERITAELAARDDPYRAGANAYQRAAIRARLGDLDRAVELLRKAQSAGWGVNPLDRLDPDLHPLNDHREFEILIRPRG